jgi:hypothetical protein
MKEKMLWNKSKTQSVRASKIRNILMGSVVDMVDSTKKNYFIQGYYNSTEYFSFGVFDTEKEARDFIDNLHSVMEGTASREV